MIEEAVAAESELRRSVLERDVDALEQLLADDVIFIGPDGSTMDKATDLEVHRSGTMRVIHYEPVGEASVAEIAPDVARLLIVVDVKVETGSGAHEGRYLYTRIYVRRKGRFQIALAQAVPAPVD